jgi:membrane protease YdiL (CAAX protease family)
VHGPGPPAGWFEDPVHPGRGRWWDGREWTPWVATAAGVEHAAGPWSPPLAPFEPGARSPLPAAAVAWALLGVLLGIVLAGVLAGLAGLATDSLAVEIVTAQAGLYAGILWSVRLVSRRYGTGHVRRDLELAWRARDIAIGLVGSIASRVAAGIVVAVVLLATSADADSAAPEQFERYESSTAARIAIAVIAVVAAPFVEELLFRGVLLRSLRRPLGRVGATVVQAALFGLLHVDWTGRWEQGLALFLATAVLGVASAILVEQTGRLGPSVWMHAWFNLVAAVVILVG